MGRHLSGEAAFYVFLDLLGVQSWKNMLRRTRTMFERESEFIPLLDYEDADRLNTYLIKCHPPQDPHARHGQVPRQSELYRTKRRHVAFRKDRWRAWTL